MLLRSLYPEDDCEGVRPILRSAFTHLPILEKFCSVRDGLFLATEAVYPLQEPPVWSLWPKLRKLALHNQDVSRDFFEGLKKLQRIEKVVLTRTDGLLEIDVKQTWRIQFDKAEEVRPLEIVLVNVESDHPYFICKEKWTENDKLRIREMNMPISYYGDEDCIVRCQQWVKRRFLAGEPVTKQT